MKRGEPYAGRRAWGEPWHPSVAGSAWKPKDPTSGGETEQGGQGGRRGRSPNGTQGLVMAEPGGIL